MAFKAPSANKTEYTGEPRNFPVPKKGVRKARISLILDLGIQQREDIYELDGKMVAEGTDGAVAKAQKPAPQVAVFADLVGDIVDYGGDIGKQPYRLLLNNNFAGVVKGINFTTVPPKDAKGNLISGKPWTLHPQNLLTKLAKAVDKPEIIESTDIEEMLGAQLMVDVDVTEKASGKNDKDGNEIIYRNVNFKGASKVAAVETEELDEDGNAIEVVPTFADLKTPARCVTFDNAKKEDIQFIRSNLIKMIKLADNYAGSQIQKAIEAWEADKPAQAEAPAEDKVAPAKAAAKPAPKPKAKVVPDFSDMDEDIPF